MARAADDAYEAGQEFDRLAKSIPEEHARLAVLFTYDDMHMAMLILQRIGIKPDAIGAAHVARLIAEERERLSR